MNIEELENVLEPEKTISRPRTFIAPETFFWSPAGTPPRILSQDALTYVGAMLDEYHEHRNHDRLMEGLHYASRRGYILEINQSRHRWNPSSSHGRNTILEIVLINNIRLEITV